MIDRDPPVTEDELHAYVDGELPADRRDAVEAGWPSHPEDAARVAAWRVQADAIRARYGAIADEPVPARLKLDRLARAGAHWRAIAAAAAAALAFLVGGVAGWMARGASQRRRPRSRGLHHRSARRAQALHRRGPPSDRGEGASEHASGALAVAAGRHDAARAGPRDASA